MNFEFRLRTTTNVVIRLIIAILNGTEESSLFGIAFVTEDDSIGVEVALLTAGVSIGFEIVITPSSILAGPLWNEAGILIANLDLIMIEKARYDFYVVGHFA